ncbi:MAG: hypothetical protein Q7V57_11875 [Actinomycetota bacterium]|nr:hypothetical protein [Actinomycetota bacterium]
MSTEERTPVIVGVAQVVQRPGEVPLEQARGPIELMTEAALLAASDATAPALLAQAGFVGSAGGWFRYTNPAQLVAAAVGCPSAATALTAVSGTGPQDLVGAVGQRIAAGELDVALIVGGEARWSHQRLSRADLRPHWNVQPGEGTPEAMSGFPESTQQENAMFAGAPAAYALFEDRVRHTMGEAVQAHRHRIARLWEHFSEVAATNPYAWDRTPHSADSIREASPSNRMIAFPYTKAMVANNTVDMATAVIVCSLGAALAAGVPRDRMVFPQVVTSGHETWLLAERRDLDGSPALTAAARAAFAHAGLGIDEVEHIDLYACFPSIVEMSSAALGIRHDRELTVTGGLGFAAAPVGNAVGHSIAAMVQRVRGGGIGLVHGNGGMATKHSFALYATTPPAQFARIDVQATVDLRPRATFGDEFVGAVTVEAATLIHDREGPSHVIAAVLDGEGRRGFARNTDPAVFEAVVTEGLVGRLGDHRADGTVAL